MDCPTCGAAAGENAKFCAECGAKLVQVCPGCAAESPPHAKFCAECGTALGATLRATEAPPTDAPSEVALRQVTVLFADLTGYTPLTRRLGPERTHQLVRKFFGIVDTLVTDHGGLVERHIGDEVMAVFGAPVAHTNDPERALRTALAIHGAMPELSAEVGETITVHAGLASGQIVFSGGQDTATVGNAVNLAARLVALAEPGQTIVSDSVQRALGEQIDAESVGEVRVKGIDNPVAAYRVRGLADAAAGPAHVFVGREVERRQFAAVLETCRETGRGQTVYVRGDPGIGKTRLVDQFQTMAAERGFACHTGLVLDFGVGGGRDAIRDMVQSLLDRTSDATDIVKTAVERGLNPAHEVHLYGLLDLPHPDDLKQLYDSMDRDTRAHGALDAAAAVVDQTASVQSLLLRIEDIHWAEPHVLEHLARLSHVVADTQAILVMTSRIEGDPLGPNWRGGVMTSISLGPLRAEESMALADAYLTPGLARRADALIERAGGNPLFLDQLLRNADELGEGDVPGTVQSIVLARMDHLPPADREAMQAAAVFGQRFDLPELRHVLDNPSYDISGLVDHGLVTPLGDGYLFGHALIRDGAYASLLDSRRLELHGRAAGWFADRDPVLTAEHLDRAEDENAAAAYHDAAEAELAAYRGARALGLAERGLALAADRSIRFALACLRGDIVQSLGDNAGSIEAFEAALALADTDSDRVRPQIGMAAGMRVVNRYDEALALLDQAEAAASAEGWTDRLGQINYHRGNIYFLTGKLEGCLEQNNLARERARQTGFHGDEARALSGLADAHYMQGRMASAHEYFRQCVDLASAHGIGDAEAANRPPLEMTRYYLNKSREAAERVLEASAFAAKLGHLRGEMVSRSISGTIETDRFNFDIAKREINKSIEIGERIGARQWNFYANIALAKAAVYTGRRAEGATILESQRTDMLAHAANLWAGWYLGTYAWVTDSAALRQELIAEAETTMAAGWVGHNSLWFYREVVEALLCAGDWDGAESYADRLETYTADEPLPWSDFVIARCRALCALGRGRRDDETISEIRRLRDLADELELRSLLGLLDQAVAESSR